MLTPLLMLFNFAGLFYCLINKAIRPITFFNIIAGCALIFFIVWLSPFAGESFKALIITLFFMMLLLSFYTVFKVKQIDKLER